MNASAFSYKGYEGSAHISLEDNCLHGKILFVGDLVTYEAETVAQLREAFIEAVDLYLSHRPIVGGNAEHSSA